MITLIGHRATIIGFGLCGIKGIHEVHTNTTDDVLRTLITGAEHEVVMIEEALLQRVQGLKTKKIFVSIPDRYSSEDHDDLDGLVRDTIGVAIKN